MTRFRVRGIRIGRSAGVGIAVTIVLAATAVPAAPVQARELYVKLPASVQIESQKHPGPNDPERCLGYAFARFAHIRLAKGYEVAVDDTSQFDRDAVYSLVPPGPFPDDTFVWGSAEFNVPPGHHQIALSGLSTGAGCAQAILGLEGRWRIERARVSMKGAFSNRYKRPFDECRRRKAAPRQLMRPIVLGRSLEPLMVERSNSKGKVYVAREDGILNWEQRINRQWTGAGLGSALVRTDGKASARITDQAGNGILIGPNMTVRIEAGARYQVVSQGSKSFGSLGNLSITGDVSPGCVIATQ